MSGMPPPLPQHQPQPVLAYAAPASQPTGLAIWRRGDQLLTVRDIHLPPTCVKCNRPEAKRIRKDVYWHEQWLYLTILAGVLVYAILALVLRKKATYSCGLCEEHARRRSINILVTWLIVGAGVVSLFLGFTGVSGAWGSHLEDTLVWFIPLGFLLLVVGALYSVFTLPVLKPKRVDEHYAHYVGCDDTFLRQFPEA